jgi:hypothetical protein
MAINDGIFTLEEFNNRGVIKLAPDALLYIGSGLNQTRVVNSISVASTTGQNKIELNGGISSITINNTIDTPGASTASIEVSTPIYGENSQYWINYPGPDANTTIKYSIFVPMMEVKVFFKGRFMVNNKPQYYQAFWGFITNVEESYSGGVYKIALQCCDILHWWSYHKINVHPTPESSTVAGVPQPLTFWSTIFKNTNAFSIIQALTELSGNISFVTPAWLGQLNSIDEVFPKDEFALFTQGQIMTYWRQRFATIGNFLKMYGMHGQLVDNGKIRTLQPDSINPDKFKPEVGSLNATDSKAKNQYTLDESFLENFPVFGDLTNLGTFESAEYMTRLEIATEVKNRCDYEFFQDTNGNFVFKPPFYNLNVKGVQPYTIRPNDIINFSLATDVEAITTVMTVNFPFARGFYSPELPLKKGFHMDVGLVQKYGVKYEEISVNYLTDAKLARSYAAALMGTKNAKSIAGSITIPGRPEMKMGYPVYVEHRDAFYYVRTISHTFDFGGTFTTTLGIEAERKKVYEYEVIDKIKQTGFRQPLARGVYRLADELVKNNPINPNDPPSIDMGNDKIKAILSSNQHTASATQGRYVVDFQRKKVDGVELGPIDTDGSDHTEDVITDKTYPYTDEEGYAVIGAFTYGRGLNPYFLDKPKRDDISKKTYEITMMSKPAYKAESDAMKNVFSQGEEGTVPAYTELLGGAMPSSLGQSIDVHTVGQTATITDTQKEASVTEAVTNATAGAGNKPTGALVDQSAYLINRNNNFAAPDALKVNVSVLAPPDNSIRVKTSLDFISGI